MATINTAIQLSNIRSKIDAQQQIISMLELELQKAILGDDSTTIDDLFKGKDLLLEGEELGTVNLFNVDVTGVYHFDDQKLLRNTENNKTYVLLEGEYRQVQEVAEADVRTGVGAENDTSYGDTAGVQYNWTFVQGAPTITEAAADEGQFVTDDGTGGTATEIVGVNNIYNSLADDYGVDLSIAMRNGVAGFESGDGKADQTVIRQMLYQARALLGELRVEEQHWNQEVTEEKQRRKDLGEFAKG